MIVLILRLTLKFKDFGGAEQALRTLFYGKIFIE
jgi:hypothetical protein